MNKMSYQYNFLIHSGNPNHLRTKEDIRLREVILRNYFKSFLIWNSISLYLNYIRRNKSIGKSLATISLMTVSSLCCAFYFNERFLHLDHIFKTVDPNLLVNTSVLSNKEYLDLKLFQAIVFNNLKHK